MNFKRIICDRCRQKFRVYHDEIMRERCDWCIDRENEEKMLSDSVELIEKSLNPANREKFKEMSAEDRKLIAMQAWMDGLIKWKLGRRQASG